MLIAWEYFWNTADWGAVVPVTLPLPDYIVSVRADVGLVTIRPDASIAVSAEPSIAIRPDVQGVDVAADVENVNL